MDATKFYQLVRAYVDAKIHLQYQTMHGLPRTNVIKYVADIENELKEAISHIQFKPDCSGDI